MNNLSPLPGGNTPQGDSQVPSYLSQQRQRDKPQEGEARILQLWYRIASPPQPDDSAPFEERELFRRGRTGSQIIIFLFILLFISYPAAFAGSNSLLIAILTIDLFILSLATMLNRLRRVNTAGIMVVLIFVASPTVNILTTPGGVNTSALPIFGLLVLPLMCAVSFLPPWWVFVVGAANCLFTLYVLKFMPSSGELHEVLKVAFPGIVTPILLGQGIVSIVAFLWVRGARQALLRADRAEVILALERREIERQQRELELKHQLDTGIQQILETHVQVSNGNFTARAPLTQDNILWRIAYSLNNLLARLQSSSKAEAELQHMRTETARLVELVRIARELQRPMPFWRSGTALDALILELSSIPSGSLLPLSGAQTLQAIHSPRKPNSYRLEKLGGTPSKELPRLDPSQPKNHL
ncbi:MAG: hypothetical protein JO202_12140 [Ktedonobacteraceae bacterium]|nr:hypothetical protein [Ktedonobacteraceae bacterium]